MTAAVARLVGRVVIAAALAAGAVTPPPSASSDAAGQDPQATIRTEVRLRKLHLVRPDLIPYPIAYEVCC
jgi:hypothetical protein